MDNALIPIPEARIFGPGDIYILHEKSNPECTQNEMIEFLFFLRSEDEIMPVLDVEVNIYRDYKLINFLGCRKRSDTCFELKMLVYDREKRRRIEYSLYLHRIQTAQEMVRIARRN
jgi:hypothetical protein